jgi:acyl-CoA synthetase (AMP-forming)/AMP-acid ligase II
MANQGTLSWPMTRAMATRPNAEAIVDGETRLTYAQWGRRVRGLTAGLRSLGLRTGDVVASIGQNSFRHLECWVGIPTAGMVLNDLNYRLAIPELEFIINDCEARAIVADGARLYSSGQGTLWLVPNAARGSGRAVFADHVVPHWEPSGQR